jgi:hypothetical protein
MPILSYLSKEMSTIPHVSRFVARMSKSGSIAKFKKKQTIKHHQVSQEEADPSSCFGMKLGQLNKGYIS